MVKLLSGIAVVVLLTGCASDGYDEYQRRVQDSQRRQTTPTPVQQQQRDDPALKNIPVRDRGTSQPTSKPAPPMKVEVKTPEPVSVAVTKPKEPTLTDVLKDKVLISPYTLISPISGKWAWVPDPTFVLILTQEGQMQYGPTQGGFYQMMSPTQIRFQITQVNGVSVGGTAPQDWQVAFFENNTVLLLSRGAQAMPFKRVE